MLCKFHSAYHTEGLDIKKAIWDTNTITAHFPPDAQLGNALSSLLENKFKNSICLLYILGPVVGFLLGSHGTASIQI